MSSADKSSSEGSISSVMDFYDLMHYNFLRSHAPGQTIARRAINNVSYLKKVGDQHGAADIMTKDSQKLEVHSF